MSRFQLKFSEKARMFYFEVLFVEQVKSSITKYMDKTYIKVDEFILSYKFKINMIDSIICLYRHSKASHGFISP